MEAAYSAITVSVCQLLFANGHCWSLIVNTPTQWTAASMWWVDVVSLFKLISRQMDDLLDWNLVGMAWFFNHLRRSRYCMCAHDIERTIERDFCSPLHVRRRIHLWKSKHINAIFTVLSTISLAAHRKKFRLFSLDNAKFRECVLNNQTLAKIRDTRTIRTIHVDQSERFW